MKCPAPQPSAARAGTTSSAKSVGDGEADADYPIDIDERWVRSRLAILAARRRGALKSRVVVDENVLDEKPRGPLAFHDVECLSRPLG